jgi:quinol monooxygenase YgiN
MITLLVRHKVADYERWKAAFDQQMAVRHHGGERSCRIFRSADDPNELTLLFEWEDLNRARSFMNSPEARSYIQQAGVTGVPEIHFLTEMYTVRRSAAD